MEADQPGATSGPHLDTQTRDDTALRPYGIATLLAVLAFLFWRAGIDRTGLSPFFLYLAAVTVASGMGGLGPGILVILFGVIATSNAYEFPGLYVLSWPRGVLQLALFLFISIPITLLQEQRLRILARERTSRRRTERLMAEQTAMMEQMTEAVLIADPAGAVTYMNEAAKRIFAAHQGDHVSATRMWDWLHVFGADGEDVPADEFALVRAAGGETLTNIERMIQRPDGSRLAIVASARQVRGPDGRVLGAIATVRDVTTERELERQREGFLSMVVHDLKSPLATIKGVSQLLHRRLTRAAGLPPDLVESLTTGLEDIDGKVSQMVGVINDIVETGRQDTPLRLQSTDCLALIRRLCTVFDRSSDLHTVRLETELQELIGEWDKARLERAFENVLSNAMKYSPRGGSIRVGVERGASDGRDEALITVSDPGIGIPVEDQGRVFEQFYRARNATEVASGTGIGLAAVKHTVEKHGGTIGIESGAREGTTVWIRLPLHRQEEHPVPDSRNATGVPTRAVQTSSPRGSEDRAS